LTIHADNGSSMASKPVAFLLADLGVTKSHSRPHTGSVAHSRISTMCCQQPFGERLVELA
jgi:putative transposase